LTRRVASVTIEQPTSLRRREVFDEAHQRGSRGAGPRGVRGRRWADFAHAGPEPNSTQAVSLIFRVNAIDFDGLSLTLGLTDRTTGRTFTVAIPLSSFSGVVPSLTPLGDDWVELQP
jgi:hypothetical protein